MPLPAGGPDPDALHAALVAAVGSAMYWQPPDGTDVLAAEPQLRAGLHRIAAWAAPAAPAWWTAPAPGEQHTLGWWGDDPREVGTSIGEWRAGTLAAEEEARREYPAEVPAPYSGTWRSFPDGVAGCREVDGAPAGLDLEEDAGGTEDVTVHELRLPAGARILEVDSPRVWAELCRAHPLEVTASRRHDWYRVTGRDGRWVIPDWAAVAGEWDGVHLTVAAYLAGATRAIDVDESTATLIAGWAPDCTRWLIGPTGGPEIGPPVTWRWSEDGGYRPDGRPMPA
ncbi:hypothetical protein [Pseudactinotalea sp. HY160]|uniref:hypothetical protein n=1 Tax=Pseudactinotalea sp. HY160 TaxID=2654490 RepID=UPI00188474DF|nr:hypothetical protein [Pseudactinotalea sp. HY160]